MATGRNDWTPKPSDMPIRVLRFSDDLLADSVETHVIEGVSVKVFGVAKTVADCFRHRGKIGLAVALEGLQEALRQRKTTPAEIARAAETGGVRSEEHTSELQSLMRNSYAVFRLKKKTQTQTIKHRKEKCLTNTDTTTKRYQIHIIHENKNTNANNKQYSNNGICYTVTRHAQQ